MRSRNSNAAFSLALLLLPLVIGCGVTTDSDAPGAPAQRTVSAIDRLTSEEVAESVLATMDRSADPCADFYRYACGSWLEDTELPADRPRWGRGFSTINERNLTVLREILDEARGDSHGDAELAKIGDFYETCMDEEAIEAAGTEPLKPMLEEIAGVDGPGTFMKIAGEMQGIGIAVGFQPFIDADFKKPDVNIAHFHQGGLGLPDRDYYVNDDEKSQEIRRDYATHVRNMLILLGESEESAARSTEKIIAFETKLAEASLPRAETRELDKLYNKIDLEGLARATPGLDWELFLEATGYPRTKSINVTVPRFFERLSAVVSESDAEVLQAYLRWNLVHAGASRLPRAFVDENFAFFGAKLGGQKEIQPRWKRCVNATDSAMGEILGRYFVERQFSGDSKEKAVEMIEGIEGAFEARLAGLGWMDDETRARAKEKSAAVTNKIGYPDEWRDYSALEIRGEGYYRNGQAADRFEFERNWNKIDEPVDRMEWDMTPPTVNAFYNPLLNQMVFPAGIMQPPFFHRDFPAAMNFGGVGMGMGHELTHGFDDQGRKFDKSGKLNDWWEPGVVEKFNERAQCIDDLYAGYEVQPDLHLNGKLTLGENIADLGAIKQTYAAYKDWERVHGEPQPIVEGLTNDQLFFVGFAQTWCTLATPEIERLYATIDPHSPPRFRVLGALSNFPQFAQAFNCEAGTPMNPEKRCEVW